MTKRDLLIDFLGWYQRNTQEEGTENEKWMDEATVDSYLNQPNGSNMVLAVSGPSEEEIDLAAMQYATKMSAAPDKETPDWIMTDFKAGIAWLLRYQAACASGAAGTVAAGGVEPCTCPDQFCLLGDHPTCRWAEYARKSSEGQP